MRYACEFRNAAGERRIVVVGLAAHERHDVMSHRALRGANGPGGPTGPIARGYALRRASERVPSDFVPVLSNIRPIVSVEGAA